MDEFYITSSNPNHLLAQNPRERMRYAKKYSADIVENLEESPRGAWMVRHPSTDGPLFASEPPVPPQAPSTRMDGLRRTGGQSVR
jgi:hypothetical protein